MNELLVNMAEYQVWANNTYRKTITTISEDEYTRDVGLSCGSIRDVCVHINAAMIRCLAVMTKKRDATEDDLIPVMKASRSELMRIWERNDQQYLQVCQNQNLKRIECEEFSKLPVEDFLFQYTNHTTHHRGTLPVLLRRMGHKPEGTDYLDYLFEKHGI